MSVAAIFEALGDPNRRQIMAFLADGEASVTEVADQFSVSLAAVSQHLKVLREAGLVTVRSRAQQRRCADHECEQHGAPPCASNVVPGGCGDLCHACICIRQRKTGSRGDQASDATELRISASIGLGAEQLRAARHLSFEWLRGQGGRG